MLFSEFAQKHNVNLKQVDVGEHAIGRARQRFNWNTHQDTQIVGNLRALLKNSVYVGEIIDEDGQLSHMFAADKRGIYLSPNFKKIKTVMNHDKVTYTPLKNKMLELHRKEIRKLTRKEGARLKYLENLKYDCDVDIALLKRRIKRTKSQAVKNACEAKIEAIKQTINEYEQEIRTIQSEKRAISRSLVSVL